LIVDDGSEDETRKVVADFDDPRIRYIFHPQSNIPGARNRAVAAARGEFVCIADDDDLMLPTRVESHLRALDAGAAGSYGGWIDYDLDTGHLVHHPGRPRSLATLLFSGRTMMHPASMVRRSVLAACPYDEGFAFGSDYEMNLRLAEAGHRLNHTGDYLIVRRLHGSNVTLHRKREQRTVGARAATRILAGLDEAAVTRMREEAERTQPFEIANTPTVAELRALFPVIGESAVVVEAPAVPSDGTPRARAVTHHDENPLAAVVEETVPWGGASWS
jgi:glycosyltransferase involved in cell wall biosynthesis